MRRTRTPQAPLFKANRPIGHAWAFTVTMSVYSSGYVGQIHVTAKRLETEGQTIGTAYADISIDHDVNECIQELAVEAMLVAVQQTLMGEPPMRKVQLSASSAL